MRLYLNANNDTYPCAEDPLPEGYWLWMGLVLGLGLFNKIGLVVFGLALVIGLAATGHRRYFTDRRLYLAGAMAAVIATALETATTDEQKATILFMRGAMHERQKQYDEAEAAFQEVLRLTPENSSAMNYLGYMLADRNVRLEEAQELITKALEQEPNNGAYLDSLGWVYYRMDRLEEAQDYLHRAAQRVSRDPVVHDHLGDVYFRQGKLKEAIAQWQTSLKEWASIPAGEKDPSQVAAIQKKLEGAEGSLARESSPSKTKQP